MWAAFFRACASEFVTSILFNPSINLTPWRFAFKEAAIASIHSGTLSQTFGEATV
jgi:hypothetical protein